MGIRVAIHGAGGRMGRCLMSLVCADPELKLGSAIEYAGHPLIGKAISDLEPTSKSNMAVTTHIMGEVDVVIDFSTPEASMELLNEVARLDAPLVLGTTGITEEQADRVHKASQIIPIMWAPNMSLGVNLLFRIAGEVAKALGDEYDIEVVEAHHNKKADAPSGTALGLAQSLCEALDRDIEADLVHGRSGRPGPRTRREIGMHALRMGSIVGDHTVHFGNEYEQIAISHRAQDRNVFAAGALRAAKWLVGRKPGLYDMQDVLFGEQA
ncbi:MAG: 4-hydroxy-tetrahydrodipicolinate reductase [Planctomycetota bacterium]|jgi:4-hydroxy-tetrahydrodipicolinate reductase